VIIGKKLKACMKEQSVLAKAFAEMIGVSEGMVYKYYNMSGVDTDILEKWAKALDVPLAYFFDNMGTAKADNSTFLRKTTPISSKMQPVLDMRVSAGHGVGLEGSENKVIEWVNIPKFEGCYGITVFGDSMYDRFKSGDIVFVRPIESRNDFDFGQCYVIVTNEDRYIKNVYESPKGDNYITLVSFNVEVNPDGRRKYPDKDVHVNDIKHLYKVSGKLRRDQL